METNLDDCLDYGPLLIGFRLSVRSLRKKKIVLTVYIFRRVNENSKKNETGILHLLLKCSPL